MKKGTIYNIPPSFLKDPHHDFLLQVIPTLLLCIIH